MKRHLDVTLAVSVLALMLSLATLAYASVRNRERAQEIHRATRIAVARDCRLSNEQALAIRAFVTDAAPALRVKVALAFPLRDCP